MFAVYVYMARADHFVLGNNNNKEKEAINSRVEEHEKS